MSTTKKPKSLAISRDGTTFYFSWKIGDDSYNDGQDLQYKINQNGLWTDLNCKNTATSAKITIGSPATSVWFRVRGKKKKKKKSGWVEKSYWLSVPKAPTASSVLKSKFLTEFTYNVDANNQSQEQFSNVTYETVLIPNNPTNNGSKISFAGARVISSSKASDIIPQEERGWNLASYSYTRWFRVKSHGWVGSNNVYAYAYHTYATPEKATNIQATYEPLSTVGYAVKATWTSPGSYAHPIDSITVQYLITVPEVEIHVTEDPSIPSWQLLTSRIKCPNVESGWISLNDLSGDPNVKKDRAISFTIPTSLNNDECIFLRVNNKHDDNTTYGDPILVQGGFARLTSPEIKSVVPGGRDNLYTITVDRKTAIDNAWIGVFFRTKSNPSQVTCIGAIPPKDVTGTVQDSTSCIIPALKSGDVASFGVKAYVSGYSPIDPTSETEPTIYRPQNYGNRMESQDINWDGGEVPLPPKLSLGRVNDTTIQASWDWSWRDANQAELSWADHSDAWESTDGPQTYIVDSTNAGHWNIAGLGVGTWYVRIRLLKTEGDATTYGTYSAIETIKLASSPDIPALLLSDGVIGKEGEVTCYWAYVSNDGTSQMRAEVCEAFLEYEAVENPSGNPYEQGWYELINDKYMQSFDTVVESGKTYYKTTGAITSYEVLRSTETAQHITLSLTDSSLNLGWLPGETHHLAVRVMSGSGEWSSSEDSADGWSSPVPVTVADELHAGIDMSQTTLEYISTDVDTPEGEEPATRTVLSLTRLPLTIKAEGMSVGGSCLFVIERAESFDPPRPDETENEGFKGETVYLNQLNSEYCYVDLNDSEHFIGAFDDGGKYKIIVTVQDTYGQSSIIESDIFEVHWEHQAVKPEATVVLDHNNNVTMITVARPTEGYMAGDVCDIYRLSADKPELIISGGSFDQIYVDPYPALGEFGGHRVVYRTLYGDYITEDNTPAWTDYSALESDEYKHNLFGIVVDFGGEQLILPYNVTISNSWKKDFNETHYLGGSIQGDWNPAVTKTASLSTVIPIEIEPEKVEAVRRLATYTGICHVRTPDGSSYAANVDVKDDREEKWTRRLAKISLEINRIDTEGFDGMTYEEWINSLET